MKFRVNLYGVKDFNAGVIIEAADELDADEKSQLLAQYEEKRGGIAQWENQLKDVHGVTVQEVEEAEEDDEVKEIDWEKITAELADDTVQDSSS